MKQLGMLLPLVAATLVVCSSNLGAQSREPSVLPGLHWITAPASAAGQMMYTFQTVNGVPRVIDDFEIGWNWTTVPWRANTVLGARRLHCGDYRTNTNTFTQPRNLAEMQHFLERDAIPNMQLIPCVRGVGQSNEVGSNNREIANTNPSEAVAMEFAPWLVPDTTRSGRFVTRSNDSSGATFGWLNRHRGTVVESNGTFHMRYVRRAGGAPADSTPILSRATPDNELRRWEPDNEPYGMYTDYDTQNTRKMQLAVTLRRIEDDAVGSSSSDTILRIELPYAMAKDTLADKRIRFDVVPPDNPIWIDEYDLHNNLLARVSDVDNNGVSPFPDRTQFIIKRSMLPPLSDSIHEVTLIATFKCDEDTAHNPLIRDELGRSADASEIGRLGVTVWHNDDSVHGLGIELRNIRLQTPVAGQLFLGNHDERVRNSANAFLEDLATIQASIQATVQRTGAPQPSFKLWMFYGRDEGPKCYWKSYGYLNRLLQRRLMTEVNIEDADDFLHATKMSVLWQGASQTTNPEMATYSCFQGYDLADQQVANTASIAVRDSIKRAYAGVRYGMADMLPYSGRYYEDPDTFLEWNTRATINGILRPDPLPIPTSRIDHVLQLGTKDLTRGVLAGLEQTLILDYVRNNKKMLFSSEPWLAQVWLNYHMQVQGTTKPFATFRNNRPRSLGEARSSLWLPLVLGAKGLMLYRGTSSRTGDGAPFDSIPANFSFKNNFADDYEGGLFGYIRPRNTASGPDSLDRYREWMRSTSAGGDSIEADDSSNVTRYFAPSFAAVVANLHGPQLSALYAGTHTIRNVTMDVTECIARMRTHLGRDTTDSTWSTHVLSTLSLKGWYGHGFTTIDEYVGASNPLGRFIDMPNITTRLRTRHPYRVRESLPSTSNPGHTAYEPFDSTFVDLTIHALETDTLMQQSAVVAVFNRRTDSRMQLDGSAFQQYNDTSWKFAGYAEWSARARRFDQRGSREVTLPFRLAPSGSYSFIRLRQLGGGIDTIVGADRELAINLLPGEGALFLVERLTQSADTAIQRGFLAVNSQRKMILAQVLDTAVAQHFETAYDYRTYMSGDSIRQQSKQFLRLREQGPNFRYHRVWHRRNPDPTGPLTVFYQRSALLRNTDSAGSASGRGSINALDVSWEPPIVLSNAIFMGKNALGNDIIDSASCGYPSLVVRYDPLRNASMVYVVYACSASASTPQIMICEAQLDADAQHVVQEAGYRNTLRSHILAYASSEVCSSADWLSSWGTPVINASLSGNYYAWSDAGGNKGIVTAYKFPHERTFAQRQTTRIPPLAGTKSQFPTMHSYSKLLLGEEDCSLVWQASDTVLCDQGVQILYTRLHEPYRGSSLAAPLAQLPGPEFRLRTRRADRELRQLRSVAAPQTTITPDSTMACLTCGTGNSGLVFREHPTLYRNLSEYIDTFMLPTSSLYNVGYVNHKAERIMWEERVEEPAIVPVQNGNTYVARIAVDLTDEVQQTTIWTSATNTIEAVNADVLMPEIIQGEAKTVFATNLDTDREHAATSWRYGDTSSIASIVIRSQDSTSAMRGSWVGHVTFYDNLFFSPLSDILIDRRGLSNRPRAVVLIGEGEQPHVAARSGIIGRWSLTGLTKNRRIMEHGLQQPQSPTYINAPLIDYSARGFFKEDADDDQLLGDMIFVGYRWLEGAVTINGVMLGKSELQLDREYDLPRGSESRLDVLRSSWFSLTTPTELHFNVRTIGEHDEHVFLAIERRSDGSRVVIPLRDSTALDDSSKRIVEHSISIGTVPNDEFRLVLAPLTDEPRVVTDAVLRQHLSSNSNAKQSTYEHAGNQIVVTARVNLRTMTYHPWNGTRGSEQGIEVAPQPVDGTCRIRIHGLEPLRTSCTVRISDVTGRDVARRICEGLVNGMGYLELSMSDLAPGTYIISVDGTQLRSTVVVQ